MKETFKIYDKDQNLVYEGNADDPINWTYEWENDDGRQWRESGVICVK